MRRLQLCLAVFAVLALSFSAFAQVQNGQFTGVVTDPTGAAIAGAKVSATNSATNLSVDTTTNAAGNYSLKELPVGSYKLSAEASGFKTVTNANVEINAGTIAHVDFKMQMGQAKEVVEVTGAAAAVNTEDSKLASTVSSTQINNLPLNGRNVFDLMQLNAGAVNVMGVDFENGHGTVINGLREDFNGFLINGVSNKGLSGGAVNVPIQDTVEEFQQLQLNMSAQYGNSASGTVNLVTKSGTNAYHGSVWWYGRNDVFDANTYFLNRPNEATGKAFKPALRFNQFGGTLGGPIIKDKLFFFASYQGDRFNTVASPITTQQETQAWRDAVIQADANANAGPNPTNSVAAALYKNFVPSVSTGGTGLTANTYTGGDFSPYLCLSQNVGGTPLMAQKWANIFGVTPADQAAMAAAGCANIPGVQAGTLNRDTVIQENGVSVFKTQTQTIGNLFNGNEYSGRLDYNLNTNNRLYVQFNYLKETDKFGPCNTSCGRGFSNPTRNLFPNGQFSFVHTFSPTILNEVRLGYVQNNTGITVGNGGVPSIGFGDGTAGFGSYNGYPQSFKENIYTYSDMVSISHGNHNMKIGADFRRNIENSEFNVARPSYYFYDQVFFAADAPYLEVGGVDPGICNGHCTPAQYNQNPTSQLSSNFRHWRNLEFGAYFQDDWKVNKRLTLQLGLRYDLYQRHHELNDLATTFIPGPGVGHLQQIGNANVPAGTIGTINGTTYDCTSASAMALSNLAGICGPGGFAPASSLGAGDHNNFGPRIGFAYDVFGDGKTSLRGGFGVAYEGTLYNPLSNSRWNLPYYSFNEVIGGVGVPGADTVYGPTTCTGTVPSITCTQTPNVPVTFTGANMNPYQGPAGQSQAQGNIIGWDPSNPNFANLTGIIFPTGVRDPYVYNYYLGIQREVMPKTVVELNYVGTTGHKLFRAEDVNRQPGVNLPAGVQAVDNFGRTWTGLGHHYLNPNYGHLRVWGNVVNSSYNSLQASVKHQMTHGLLFNVNYTYSHSLDNGSTWHSGATTANGAAAGEGYTTDQTLPQLDRGNSIYDIRNRLVLNYVYQLPGQNLTGAKGILLGGWSYNGIWAFQSGAHWEPYLSSGPALTGDCSTAGIAAGNCQNLGGDFNLDGGRNDRPDSSFSSVGNISRSTWGNGWGNCNLVENKGTLTLCGGGTPNQAGLPTISRPSCIACVSNLGRNTFVGPGSWYADMTLSKNFKITERFNLKFDANAFNIFNRANFLLATAGGGAHNKPNSGLFGQAAGTLNARNLQFGLKLNF